MTQIGLRPEQGLFCAQHGCAQNVAPVLLVVHTALACGIKSWNQSGFFMTQ